MTLRFPEPDLIIFDCDGVLVDSEVLSCACLSDVLARCASCMHCFVRAPDGDLGDLRDICVLA